MAESIEINVRYFAALREGAGRTEERVLTQATTAEELYVELQARYGFLLKPKQLKVAVNDEFEGMSYELKSGQTVVFIPPVAGG